MAKRLQREKIFSFLFWLIFSLLIFSLTWQVSYNYLDPDLGWHLKIGQDIVQTKQVPQLNNYNYTIYKSPWVDHEWLPNAVMYSLYRYFGYWPLTVGFSLLIVGFFWLQFYLIKKYYTASSKALLLLPVIWLLGWRGAAPHIGVRVQEIALLNLVFLSLIIAKYEKTQKTKTLFWLIPLFVFWANVHGSFLIGLVVLGFWLAIKFIEPYLLAKKYFAWLDLSVFKKKHLKAIFVFFILAVAATLLNPYGYKLYSFLWTYRDSYYLRHIQEWLPVYALPIQYWQIFYSGLALSAVFISGLLFYFSGQEKYRLKLKEVCFLFLFLFMAFQSKRHFPLLFAISLPFLIKQLSVILDTPLVLKKILNTRPLRLYLQVVVLAALAVSSVASFSSVNFFINPFQSFCSKYPCQAVQFLKNNSQYKGKRLFARFGWGGYLLWQWPEKKLFIDGRLPQYPFAGHTLLAEYYDFFDKDLAAAKLSQYQIQAVLLPAAAGKIKLNWLEKHILGLNEEKANKDNNYLLDYLKANKQWRLVYNDKTSLIYVKK